MRGCFMSKMFFGYPVYNRSVYANRLQRNEVAVHVFQSNRAIGLVAIRCIATVCSLLKSHKNSEKRSALSYDSIGMSLCCLLDACFGYLWWLVLPLLALITSYFIVRWLCDAHRKPNTVAFFHPYCNAGGGGERVLWCAVRSIQDKYPGYRCVIYSGDLADGTTTARDIVSKAASRFNVTVDADSVDFVALRWRRLVEADLYPVCTLLGQFLGGALLGCEALYRCVPTVFIDSMGYPATLPLFRWIGGCRVAAYVHYPVISTDMLRVVESREASFNNSSRIANSSALSGVKLIYYRLFAWMYGLCGKSSEVNMVNSTWTKGHIDELWNRPMLTRIVYPPCNTVEFESEPNVSEMLFPDDVRMISIGQFRSEKNHRLQLEALAELRRRQSSSGDATPLTPLPTLVLVGSCRHELDMIRVESLKALAESLGVSDSVRWLLNVPFEQLKEELSQALIGIHTMTNEHFGIGVVEGMAAGNIMIAHNSGGPKMDIVKWEEDDESDRVGSLADSAAGYADAVAEILSLSTADRNRIRSNATASVGRFNDAHFAEHFSEAILGLL